MPEHHVVVGREPAACDLSFQGMDRLPRVGRVEEKSRESGRLQLRGDLGVGGEAVTAADEVVAVLDPGGQRGIASGRLEDRSHPRLEIGNGV